MVNNSDPLLERDSVKNWLKIKADSTLYNAINNRGFPKPIKLSPGKSGRALWRRSEVQAWIDAQGCAE